MSVKTLTVVLGAREWRYADVDVNMDVTHGLLDVIQVKRGVRTKVATVPLTAAVIEWAH